MGGRLWSSTLLVQPQSQASPVPLGLGSEIFLMLLSTSPHLPHGNRTLSCVFGGPWAGQRYLFLSQEKSASALSMQILGPKGFSCSLLLPLCPTAFVSTLPPEGIDIFWAPESHMDGFLPSPRYRQILHPSHGGPGDWRVYFLYPSALRLFGFNKRRS